jgi:hypothetical protein
VKKRLFCFALKRNEKIGSETKQKYAVLISLWFEVKNSKQKEVKKKLFFVRVSVRNESRFTSFHFEAKKTFL